MASGVALERDLVAKKLSHKRGAELFITFRVDFREVCTMHLLCVYYVFNMDATFFDFYYGIPHFWCKNARRCAILLSVTC